MIRPASGTWGTLLAWAIWVAAAPAASDLAIGVFLAVAFLYGCWACHRVGRHGSRQTQESAGYAARRRSRMEVECLSAEDIGG
ncbi:hypothetical protein LLE87_33540, partial [Paenibacillus polymyxa]|nr:hypothetical protein [Paenibacillus polymyxa]